MFEQAAESSVWPSVETCRVLQLSAMQLPTDTVCEHIAEAIVALSVRSKLEAVVIAFQLGLIEIPSMRQSPSTHHAWSTTSS
jgi:hypothetical protein